MVGPSAGTYDRMVAAIEHCAHVMDADLDALPPAAQLNACAAIINTIAQQQTRLAEIRLRAEWCCMALLRDAAGRPPRSRRESAFLANWGAA